MYFRTLRSRDDDSWTAPVDVARIPPTADTTTGTIDQVRALVNRLAAEEQVPMFVFDAGYDPIAIGAPRRCHQLRRFAIFLGQIGPCVADRDVAAHFRE
jgi:hypothetical protein